MSVNLSAPESSVPRSGTVPLPHAPGAGVVSPVPAPLGSAQNPVAAMIGVVQVRAGHGPVVRGVTEGVDASGGRATRSRPRAAVKMALGGVEARPRPR